MKIINISKTVQIGNMSEVKTHDIVIPFLGFLYRTKIRDPILLKFLDKTKILPILSDDDLLGTIFVDGHLYYIYGGFRKTQCEMESYVKTFTVVQGLIGNDIFSMVPLMTYIKGVNADGEEEGCQGKNESMAGETTD